MSITAFSFKSYDCPNVCLYVCMVRTYNSSTRLHAHSHLFARIWAKVSNNGNRHEWVNANAHICGLIFGNNYWEHTHARTNVQIIYIRNYNNKYKYNRCLRVCAFVFVLEGHIWYLYIISWRSWKEMQKCSHLHVHSTTPPLFAHNFWQHSLIIC